MGDFEGRTAVVTGAASGIGTACARLLAARGASVLVADLDADGAQSVAGEIGGPARAFHCDVTDPASTEAMVQAAVDAFGRLDVAVNCAGIGGDNALLADYPLETWRRVLAVNLDGVFYCMRAEIPRMIEGGGGSIVNIASIASTVALRTIAPYIASKHGVLGLTRAAALEYADQGIRVNAVGPGFVDTPLIAHIPEEDLVGIRALHPLGRLGRVEEIAELVAFLASDRASFSTGGYFTADGGYLVP